MDELTQEFKQETKELVVQLTNLLEEVEENSGKLYLLEKYGQIVDRIMGGAKSLSSSQNGIAKEVDKIGNYAELCKVVGYKSSQVTNNTQLVEICVAFLIDATETIDDLLEKLNDDGEINIKEELSDTFLDRLTWLEQQFDENLRSSLSLKDEQDERTEKEALEKDQISELLKAMGV